MIILIQKEIHSQDFSSSLMMNFSGETTQRDTCSWKNEKLESKNRSWKVFNAVLIFQLRLELPTSFFLISFQTFQFKSFQLLVFTTALSNYMYLDPT